MSNADVQLFALILGRLMGLLGLWISLSAALVPVRIRVVCALCLAWTVWSGFPFPVPASRPMPEFAVAFVAELMIGLALSLGLQLLVDGLVIGSQIISQISGLRLGAEYDASAELSSGLPKFMSLLGIVLFFLFSGHRIFISAFLDSIQIWPPGSGKFGEAGLDALARLLTQSLSLGLRVAAPAVASFLIATIVGHIVGKGLPQLTTMTFQASMNALLLPAVLCLSIGSIGWMFQQEISVWAWQVFDVMRDQPETLVN